MQVNLNHYHKLYIIFIYTHYNLEATFRNLKGKLLTIHSVNWLGGYFPYKKNFNVIIIFLHCHPLLLQNLNKYTIFIFLTKITIFLYVSKIGHFNKLCFLIRLYFIKNCSIG